MPPTLQFRATKDGQFAAECLGQAGHKRPNAHAQPKHTCDRAVTIAQLFFYFE
jgi:hypothetical protein